MDEKTVTGICTHSHYYETMKAIRFFLKFESGQEIGFEWPITMFKFSPDMNKDKEMEKTAKLMIGKKMSVISKEN